MGIMKNSMHWTPQKFGMTSKWKDKDPVQVEVQKIVSRSFINFFTTLCYIEEPMPKDYGAHLPVHHEKMNLPCIDVVQVGHG